MSTAPQSVQLENRKKKKRIRDRAISPNLEIVNRKKVKVGESRTLGKKRRDRAKAWNRKSDFHAEEKRVQGGKRG